ncbi:hypothetical protein ACRRTK_003690 [Alexandromys fortis]
MTRVWPWEEATLRWCCRWHWKDLATSLCCSRGPWDAGYDSYFIAAPSLPLEHPVTAICPSSTHKRPTAEAELTQPRLGLVLPASDPQLPIPTLPQLCTTA